MAKQILIVDDDFEYNALLRDVFEQAGYHVLTALNVKAAIETLNSNQIDLLVTDFRMPELSGVELIKMISQNYPDLPAVMVSGYLENSVIRDLIREGVDGVFMKPLNIFSLLKKADELISKSERMKENEGNDDQADDGFEVSLPFQFRAFPCRDKTAKAFALRVFDLRDFARNLLLIGSAGAPFELIGEDLVAVSSHKDCAVILESAQCCYGDLLKLYLEHAGAGFERITFILLDPLVLDEEGRNAIYALADGDEPFDQIEIKRRFVFCLEGDLDDYYDSGKIDEDFYIFLGAAELKIPGLGEIPEDIPLLADRILSERNAGKKMDTPSHVLLNRHPWERHLVQFRDVVLRAAKISKKSIVRADDVRAVLENKDDGGADETSGNQNAMYQYLRERRDDYLKAVTRFEVLNQNMNSIG